MYCHLMAELKAVKKRLTGSFKRLFNSSLNGISFYCLLKAVSTIRCSSGTGLTTSFSNAPKFERYLPFPVTLRFQSDEIHNLQNSELGSSMTLKVVLWSVIWLQARSLYWRKITCFPGSATQCSILVGPGHFSQLYSTAPCTSIFLSKY